MSSSMDAEAGNQGAAGPLAGRRVVVPETRELETMARMLERQGATVLRCPLVAILDLEDPAPAEAWLRRFIDTPPDDLILLTGEGLSRLMGVAATGNGRRESYAHLPMPRMTNTYMLAGDRDPAEIIASVKNGMYAANFGGGQVDITSGKYVFQCTEAYKIENGKLGAPLKGAMLIGNGPTDLHRITMIGNDLELDTGIGTCGKNGQGVPVGVGQPTLRMERITVGGTG